MIIQNLLKLCEIMKNVKRYLFYFVFKVFIIHIRHWSKFTILKLVETHVEIFKGVN